MTTRHKIPSFETFLTEQYYPLLESHCKVGDTVKIKQIEDSTIPEHFVDVTGQVTGRRDGKWLVQFDSPVVIDGVDDQLENYLFPHKALS